MLIRDSQVCFSVIFFPFGPLDPMHGIIIQILKSMTQNNNNNNNKKLKICIELQYNVESGIWTHALSDQNLNLAP